MKFVDDFLAYSKEFTGCSDSFLQWSALYALSAVAGDGHVFKTGSWDVRPSLWIMLTGGSSRYKSAGLKEARDMISHVDSEILAAQVYSTQSLLEDVADDAMHRGHRVFFYNEAESYLKLISESWNEGMRSLMMNMFDRSPIRKKIKGMKGISGDFSITTPYICWGAASTPAQIAHHLNGKTTDLLSGFFPRILLVPESGLNPAFPLPPPKNEMKFFALVDRLRELYESKECVYTISETARAIHSDWYGRITDRADKADTIINAFYLKMRDIYILKIAILSAFERGSSVLEDEDLYFSINILYPIETHWKNLIETFTETEHDRKGNRIERFIRERKEVTRLELLKGVGIKAIQLSQALQGLEQDDKIVIVKQKTEGRPKTIIRWVA